MAFRLTSGIPIAVQVTRDLSDEQRTEAQHVVDGMFRERAGDADAAVPHTEVNFGVGTV
jgi:hypothetical protein